MWEGKFLITIDEILSFALDRRLDMLPFQGSNVAVAAKPPVRQRVKTTKKVVVPPHTIQPVHSGSWAAAARGIFARSHQVAATLLRDI